MHLGDGLKGRRCQARIKNVQIGKTQKLEAEKEQNKFMLVKELRAKGGNVEP